MIRVSFQHKFEAIGTQWVIDVFDAPPDLLQDKIIAAIQRRIDAFDRRYSRFRTDTMVHEMSQKAGIYTILPNERPLLDLYERLYGITEGLVTPLIGQVLVDTGYDAQYSLRPKTHTQPVEKWADILNYDGNTLTLKKPALLDFGAAGKGFLVDEVSEILKKAGVVSFCVDAGGDMYYQSADNTPIEVGLEHPENQNQVIGSTALLNASICGSAGNRRAWGMFHHIINPRTLLSPTQIKSVWVIAASAMLADALATCLFFVSPQTLSSFEFQYLILYKDYTVEKSKDLEVKLYYNET